MTGRNWRAVRALLLVVATGGFLAATAGRAAATA